MFYLYGLYIVFSCLILLYGNRLPRNEWLLKMAFVTCIPVIGWVFLLVCTNKKELGGREWMVEIMESPKEHLKLDRVENENSIHNTVPIEEALLVSDYSSRRKVMINILKEDSLLYLEALQSAVQNDDLETSYYAASAIMEAKRRLSLSLQELSKKHAQSPDDPNTISAYASAIRNYIRSGFLDAHSIRNYKEVYIHLLSRLTEHENDAMFALEEKARVEMELKLYSEAERTCFLYLERYPNREEPYLALIRLYFAKPSPAKLRQVAGMLDKSNILLSNQGLTVVRYWLGGQKHERASSIC